MISEVFNIVRLQEMCPASVKEQTVHHVASLLNQSTFNTEWMKQRNIRIKKKLISSPVILDEIGVGKTHCLMLLWGCANI